MSRTAREPDYDFGPYEDEYRGFDVRDDETGRGPLILILALGVLLIFAGVVWNTYRQGVRPSEGGLPIIASNDAPYKRAPDERGGLQAEGQEQGYYGSMDGLGDPAVQKTAARNPVDLRRRDPVLSGGPAAQLPPVEGADAPAPITYAEAGAPVEEAQSKPIKITAVQTPPPAAPEVQPQVLPEVEPTLTIPNRFAVSGGFQVQLSALRSEGAARSAWQKLQTAAPDLYTGARLDIQRADLGAKGVFFRLRVGSFESRESAKGFCADVKATGKDCMVVAKATG